jgi:hypothetical protein
VAYIFVLSRFQQREGKVFGLNYNKTFQYNNQASTDWLQDQLLLQKVHLANLGLTSG